jgi:GTPase SAR1 family protein
VPVAIRNERLPAILDYLRDIESSGKIPWVKSKVMVLGKEGSGKTHLLRRLRNEAYDQNQSTNGVDINQFHLGDKELTWFDFGGQEVFYPTHQFFLTAQCVYLLVFRLNDVDCAERIQHWLR